MKLKKILGIISFYLLPIFLIIYFFISDVKSYSKLGDLAEKLFIFIMLIKPIAVIIKSKKILSWMHYRKEIGVAIFYLALFHTIGLIIAKSMFQTGAYKSWQFIFGSIAILSLIILAITSHTKLVKLLKENWKKVQYLAYPAFLATILHSSIATQNMNKFYIIGGLFVILKITEFNISKSNKNQ